MNDSTTSVNHLNLAQLANSVERGGNIDSNSSISGSSTHSSSNDKKPVAFPKSTEQIELEHINNQKKVALKRKDKRNKLYNKIMKEQDSNYPHTVTKKKVSYVKSMIEKSRRISQDTNLQASLLKGTLGKRRRQNKKTLTVFTPFEFKTQKRVRLDQDMLPEETAQPYEPLSVQLAKSFKLRDDTNTDHLSKTQSRILTRPKSPTFATT